MTKMTMMKTGVQTLLTAAVRAQMKAKEKVHLWPWSSSKSESLSTSFLLLVYLQLQNKVYQSSKIKQTSSLLGLKLGYWPYCITSYAFVSTSAVYYKNQSFCLFSLSVFRTQEAEKADKKLGKKRKPKKKERLEEEIEEEAGEEAEGGWEKVKGGAPLVKVKNNGVQFLYRFL